MAIPSGEIYLLHNVPLSADYQHTFDFSDKNEQFNYWKGYIKNTLSNYTYVRKEREYLTVERTMTELEDVNYLIFRSNDGERLYYAFVLNKIYVNPVTTNIVFTLDVMQTYLFDFEWKPSYIKQGHVDRWTADHKPIYSKTDEGLDYGTEYSIENAFRIEQEKEVIWALVTMTDYSSLASEGAIVENTKVFPGSSPFACFIVPIALGSASVLMQFKWGDRTISDFNTFLKSMLNSAMGNFIKSIVILPYNPLIESVTITGNTATIVEKSTVYLDTVTISDSVLLVVKQDSNVLMYDVAGEKMVLARDEWDLGLENSLPTPEEWEELKKNPRTTKRDKRFESKLLCSPYRYNLLCDWRTSPVIFKNEYMTTDKLEIQFNYALSHNAPFRYWIKDYKKDPEGRYTCLSQPMGLEMPIISDQYYTYMLENKNTIQANITNTAIGGVANTLNGIISGAGVGGIGGAIFGGLSGATASAINLQAQIRSENAKQNDIKSKSDAVLNSVDSSFNINDKNYAITFYRMRICCENEEILSEIFNMTGYKVNRVEVPNTRSRVRFNYLQTLGANIVGSINQEDLTKIKNIFDTGITIWHYSEKDFNPLDYSFENVERNLL